VRKHSERELEEPTVERERHELDERVTDDLFSERLALRAKREPAIAGEIRDAPGEERGNVRDVWAHAETAHEKSERRQVGRRRENSGRAGADGLHDERRELGHDARDCNARTIAKWLILAVAGA
jgi:hypothetical protein